MRVSESCAKCLYDRQANRTDNAEYLAEIREILEERGENDSAPYLVYLFNKVYQRYYGAGMDYHDVKKKYNDLVLGMEQELRGEIERAEDPVAKALVMARIGNYIDFGAMNHVDQEEFLALFADTEMREEETKVYQSFLKECEKAKSFLLICDNCGEIVLDKLLLEQLHKRFPSIEFMALVRGEEVLNDATLEDAKYAGLDQVAKLLTSGSAVAGIVHDMLPEDTRRAFDEVDVVLAKGQGNYETMYGQGRHVFYEFLCKCDLFVERFQVPRLTGMFVEELGAGE